MVFWVWFALNRIPNETLSLKLHKFDGVQSDIANHSKDTIQKYLS